jgi:cytochrome c553
MRKVTTSILFFLALLAITAFVANAGADAAEEKKAEHDYVSAKKCKTCHKAQFASWSETGHAKAFDLLSDEEKKKPECVGCHTTGNLADGTLLEGVQCEACHGPGKDYKSAKIMSKKKWKADPEKHLKMALDAGLVLPTEETCVKCHTKEGNANFKEFKFEERKLKVHPEPAKAEAKTKG